MRGIEGRVYLLWLACIREGVGLWTQNRKGYLNQGVNWVKCLAYNGVSFDIVAV